MMECTDRHCRVLHRILSSNALLYTEMVTAAAILRGDRGRLLGFSPMERPVALQIGGSEPEILAEAARIGAEWGYSEVNLNCGCPSDRVRSGAFGAVLMKAPELVAEGCSAMIAAVPGDCEITVKCRIGVDDQDPEAVLPAFLEAVRDAGVRRVAVHARKAWLKGLSPKENRDIPPLDHDLVRRMRSAFPDMSLSINGGIASLDAAVALLDEGFDGVMIGRAAYNAPWDIFAAADQRVWGSARPVIAPNEAAERMLPYIESHLSAGGRLHQVTRHMLGLFAGRPGARLWRRVLSEEGARDGAGTDVVLKALSAVAPVAA